MSSSGGLAVTQFATLLTNGRLETLVSMAGGGGTSLGDLAVTRWHPDVTRDAHGEWLYVRDRESGTVVSATAQPVWGAEFFHARQLGPGVVEFVRRDEGLEIVTDICVAPDADVAMRRYTLRNTGTRVRHLELTTYLELVLNTAAADAAHPAFSKLFVQTAWRPDDRMLVAWRRLRSPGDPPLWAAHVLRRIEAGEEGRLEYETDRARFIGRGRDVSRPRALDGEPLSGSSGNVLDPIFSLRTAVAIEPGEAARFVSLLAAGADERAVQSVRRFTTAAEVSRVLEAAAARAASAVDTSSKLADAARQGNYAIDVGVPVQPWGAPPRARSEPPEPRGRAHAGISHEAPEELRYFNGIGGFTADGSEYVIRIPDARDAGQLPPLPWTNVIANENAGFIVSERGAANTWTANSRENRLTPWFNDPVTDPHGEALYLRDEDAGVYWSPIPGPSPDAEPHEVRHGLGYTRWRHLSHALEQDVWMFVPRAEPVKVTRVRITNRGPTPRRLALYSYAQLVLGGLPHETARHVEMRHEATLDVILATNDARHEFASRVAFAAARGPAGITVDATGDRGSFLGGYGNPAHPSAVVEGGPLDGHFGVGGDPCAALRASFTLAPGATTEIVFLLGEASNLEEVGAILSRLDGAEAAERALEEVRTFWRNLTGCLTIQTPSPALDAMVNHWLPYQNLSCRMWGRSAFYQSGGAFGFRDQLQDASALLYLDPEITRRQILLHAAHQFVDGDVLHWWHPPLSKGIRTRFADDLLWLPLITAFYVRSTGDVALLDERTRYLMARALEPGEDEIFVIPSDSGESGTIYEHCCRAIDRSLATGAHGLPLMGVGDWNDGMNRVGREGRGESVWMGFFLFQLLEEFMPFCAARGDIERTARYRAHRAALERALNADDAGWDGGWYRRAYYDDGTPIGSASSDECRIDVIAQAWAVLSGAAPPDRAALALDAMEQHLVSEPEGIIRLLTPAFDRTPHDPGYIKGYLPGVRENGGQYTHAALWAVRALAEHGRAERAARLLEMLLPVTHTRTPDAVRRYKGEPYVVAADVYGVAPHVGRAGWTWYTGSAGWMYRVAVESVLGLEIEQGRAIVLRPCIPPDWPGYTISLVLPDGRTRYTLRVKRTTGGAPTSAHRDGSDAGEVHDHALRIPLVHDGAHHDIDVRLGPDVGRRYRERRAV